MSAPTWATIIGIFMMLVAGCGACNGYQGTQIAKVMDKFPEIIEDAKKRQKDQNQEGYKDSLEVSGSELIAEEDVSEDLDSAFADMPEEFKEMMDDVFNMSPEAKAWTIRFGYISILGAILLFCGGLFLLMPKPYSIKLAYLGLIVGMIISISQHYVLSREQGDIISMMSGAGTVFKVLISLIMMAVIFACDKEAYDFEPEFDD